MYTSGLCLISINKRAHAILTNASLMRFTCIIINFAKMNQQSVSYNSGYGGPVSETFWPVQQSVNESNLVGDDGQ